MIIELIMLAETQGASELIAAYEEVLYDRGQINYLTGSHDFVVSCIPDTKTSSRHIQQPLHERIGIPGHRFGP